MRSASLIVLTAVGALLSGCGMPAKDPPQTRVKVYTDVSCRLIRPRTWSVNDTYESIENRRQDNAAACTCPQHREKPECGATNGTGASRPAKRG